MAEYRVSAWTIAVLLSLMLAANGAPAQPANDEFANAETIAALPFNDAEPDIRQASVNAEDPWVWCRGAMFSAAAISGGANIWYRYTPAVDSYINISTETANRDTLLGVYTGATLTSLQPVVGGCGDGYLTNVQSIVGGLRVHAGETYWIVASIWSPGTPTVGSSMGLVVAEAPRHVVTKTTDSLDGSCNSDCSLREAIAAANLAPGAVIVPAGEYIISRSGGPEDLNANGDIDIDDAMSISGAGSGGGATGTTIRVADGLEQRAFHVTSAVPVLFRGLRITGASEGNGEGGGIAATAVFGILSLDDVAIVDNAGNGGGGGISANGVARITRSSILNNGALFNGGAGIRHTQFPLWIEESTIAGNVAFGMAGGGGVQSTGQVRLINSTVAYNEASFNGGGIRVSGSNGSLGMVSSTVARNFASIDDQGGLGGGVSIEGITQTHPLRNNLIASNFRFDSVPLPSDCRRSATAGALISDWNLVVSVDPSCTFAGANDINNGTDPNLAKQLADNGGPTLTLALLAPSVAIDSGDIAGCTDFRGRPLLTDQRGVARAIGDRCDRGAYERNAPDALFANGFE